MDKKGYEFNVFGRLTVGVAAYAVSSVLCIWATLGVSYLFFWGLEDSFFALIGIPVLLIGIPYSFVGGCMAGLWIFEELQYRSYSGFIAPVVYLANIAGVFVAIGLIVGIIYGLIIGLIIYAFYIIFLYAAAVGGVTLAVAAAT